MNVPPGNRRKDDRQTIDYPCWIDAGPDRPPIKGRLCDVSQTGAKLTCKDAAELPDKFNMYMTVEGNVGRRCKVARRVGNEIGLTFLSRNVPKPQWLDQTPDRPVVID
jgi:hypothetical protein